MTTRNSITGLHHVTVIAGTPQENVEFYVGVLGMRLVKKSVNQDMPDTYHLFYADGAGSPGTDLTFFPWPDLHPGRRGVGMTVEVALAVPAGSLAFWRDRLTRQGVRVGEPGTRFGERILPITDPHGLSMVLTEIESERSFTPWSDSPVGVEHQIRGLHGVRMLERELEPTIRFLEGALGFERLAKEGDWHRYALPGAGSSRVIDVRAAPLERRGSWGQGSVHHIAWRVPDDLTQLKVRERIRAAGREPTEVIDRFWFRSVYFREPGGALFEIATDGPGFTADETLDALGTALVLPPWLEPKRADIEAGLAPISPPVPSRGR